MCGRHGLDDVRIGRRLRRLHHEPGRSRMRRQLVRLQFGRRLPRQLRVQGLNLLHRLYGGHR
jgi:hypothetical protein